MKLAVLLLPALLGCAAPSFIEEEPTSYIEYQTVECYHRSAAAVYEGLTAEEVLQEVTAFDNVGVRRRVAAVELDSGQVTATCECSGAYVQFTRQWGR